MDNSFFLSPNVEIHYCSESYKKKMIQWKHKGIWKYHTVINDIVYNGQNINYCNQCGVKLQ